MSENIALSLDKVKLEFLEKDIKRLSGKVLSSGYHLTSSEQISLTDGSFLF
jgi:hypothetical protein